MNRIGIRAALAAAALCAPAGGRGADPDPPDLPWLPRAATYSAPRGDVVRAGDVEDLFRAVQEARPGTTILLEEGVYRMPRYLEIRTDGVAIRGATGRRERVILDGSESTHGDLIGIARAEGAAIIDLTIRNVRWNGVRLALGQGVRRATIYNCLFRNVWESGVKTVPPKEGDPADAEPQECRIRYCVFWNERPKATSDGNPVGGIEAAGASGWIIRENAFVGIRGRAGKGRGAIVLSGGARDSIIERNVIIDCDAGIGLGTGIPGGGTEVRAARCIVRNNFVTRTPAWGILADATLDSTIIHNTIHDPGASAGRLIWITGENRGLIVANNLVSGAPIRNESKDAVSFGANLERPFGESFVDPEGGNLRLRASAAGAIDHALPLRDAREDIDGVERGAKPDIGAHEFLRETP
ncbi:MAG: right-handed parallel beta-helix repeat-containing protein [Planctomycetes bacterium]|nr:right-handed parallel beta-helix repeat-containing protein [Planctomycetota bacterium]